MNHARPTPVQAPHYRPLVIALVAVAAGIVGDRLRPVDFGIWMAAAVVGMSGWFWLWTRRRDRLACVALVAVLAALGGAWHHGCFHLFADDELGACARAEAGPAAIAAVVSSAPSLVQAPPPDPLCAIRRGERCRLEVRVVGARDGMEWRRASGNMRLTVDGLLPDVSVGDRLRVVGQLAAPRGPQNPGEFDFATDVRGRRCLSLLSADFPQCVEVVERAAAWRPARLFDALRRRGRELLVAYLDEHRASLAAALLLGVRDGLDQETVEAFSKTGTVHVLSISGMHVGLLAVALLWASRLGVVGRGLALSAVGLVTLGYALVIEAESPAVRATVAVLLCCIALYRRRRFDTFNALAAAALLVLATNPTELFRIGPQLSFLAAATLAWFGPRFVWRPSTDPLDRLIARTRPWPERWLKWCDRGTWHATCLTACVWGVSVPLVMAQFHLFSPATLLLTPLLAVPTAVGLISGFPLLAVGWAVPPLAAVLGWVCDGCLWFLDAAVVGASRVPGGHAWVPGPGGWWLAGFYAALTLWAVAPRWRPPRRWCLALVAGWSTVGLMAPVLRPREADRLDCTFLSVGHGCAAVLELPGGRTLLYDAGRLGSPATAARSVENFLWSRGRTHIDAIVLSHANVDHYNAVPELLERFSVGVIYVSPTMFDDETAALDVLRSAVQRARVPLSTIEAGDRLRVGGDCRIEVLHPPPRLFLAGDNANSLVLAVECGHRRLLLTGDLETPGMEQVLAEEPLDCDVILAPHHGSLRSNPPGFTAWSTPEWVVISGSASDRHGGAEEAYQTGGANVLHTAAAGAVTVSISTGRVALASFLSGERAGPLVRTAMDVAPQ